MIENEVISCSTCQKEAEEERVSNQPLEMSGKSHFHRLQVKELVI